MKKVFLLSLGLLIGMTGFAQRQSIKKDVAKVKAVKETRAYGNDNYTLASAYAPQSQSVVSRDFDPDYDRLIWSYYDLQSNHMVNNRMYELPTGQVGVVMTMSHESSGYNDRGTGYNFFDGESWSDEPDARIESMKTGWPSIAQWGETGEILVAHAPIKCWTREVAGEGEWQFNGILPYSPEGFEFDDDASWPRIATSGDNHNIVHIIADIQHSFSSDSVGHWQVVYRSEDPTDNDAWVCNYSPLADYDENYNIFSADDYAIAANGHTVAILYTGSWDYHTILFKSYDDGLTWEKHIVWENPYAGLDWVNDSASLFGEFYMPMAGDVVIDDYGTCHVALSVWVIDHDELGNSVSIYYGLSVDGVAYWNDGMGQPIQSKDGNPDYALRLWWPDPEDTQYIQRDDDSTKWIGFVPRYQGVDWSNTQLYHGEDYWRRFGGISGTVALSVDQYGNLACAFSSADMLRTDGTANNYYLRNIYVSYRNIDEAYWHPLEDALADGNFLLEESECIFPIAAPRASTPGEFWIGFHADDLIGLSIGTGASQASATENGMYVVKVTAPEGYWSVPETTEAKDVVYEIYPNPATDYVIVKSSMDAAATVTFTNLAGQTVKSYNKNLTTGENSINIDLESGVYFMTVNANGFNKTTKVVVK